VRHLPNLICIARILLVWPILAALRGGDFTLAMVLFSVAAASDGLDGWLAKRFNWTSQLGLWLDPVADKVLLMAVFIVSAWLGLVPRWLTAAAVARDLAIVLGAIVFRLWFGPLHGHPTVASKFNTLLQGLYLLCVMSEHALGVPPPALLTPLAFLTLLTTLASGAQYVVTFGRRAWAMPAGA
jgi:cardiolipin synthase (CMP-forming)